MYIYTTTVLQLPLASLCKCTSSHCSLRLGGPCQTLTTATCPAFPTTGHGSSKEPHWAHRTGSNVLLPLTFQLPHLCTGWRHLQCRCPVAMGDGMWYRECQKHLSLWETGTRLSRAKALDSAQCPLIYTQVQ